MNSNTVRNTRKSHVVSQDDTGEKTSVEERKDASSVGGEGNDDDLQRGHYSGPKLVQLTGKLATQRNDTRKYYCLL